MHLFTFKIPSINPAIFEQSNLLMLRQKILGSGGCTPQQASIVNALSKEQLIGIIKRFGLVKPLGI